MTRAAVDIAEQERVADRDRDLVAQRGGALGVAVDRTSSGMPLDPVRPTLWRPRAARPQSQPGARRDAVGVEDAVDVAQAADGLP